MKVKRTENSGHWWSDCARLAACILVLLMAAGSGDLTSASQSDSGPRPSCFVGGVSLGPRAGAIDFWARCRPTAPSGDIDVGVSRMTPNESQFLPLKAFRRFPLLLGSGDVRRGRCVRVRRSSGELNCGATTKGSAVFKGRIWVGVEGWCAGRVHLVSWPSYEPCRGVCTSVFQEPSRIASGAPRGC